MEKVSLLDKLKTLKEWQRQQQLNFAQIKKEQNVNNYQMENIGEDKENIQPYSNSKDIFLKLMKPNELRHVLSNIQSEENFDMSMSGDSNTNDDDDDDGGIDHWHMSGLATVVPKSNNLFTPSNSGDETASVAQMEGVTPFSDTDIDDYNDNDHIQQYLVASNTHYKHNHMKELDISKDTDSNDNDNDDFDGSSSNMEENENTVIENNQNNRQLDDNDVMNLKEERPIQSKLSGNSPVTFEQLIEREIQSNQVEELNTSTPMKSKKHNFLKRGEGLKRFHYGVLQQQRKEALANKKKKIAIKPGGQLKLNKNVEKVNKMNQQTLQTKLPLYKRNDYTDHQQEQVNQRNNFNTKDPVEVKIKATSKKENILINNVNKDGASPYVIMEMSFQNLQHDYKQKEEEDVKELDQFEELEEAAENISLSSNSSLVAKFLGKKKKETNVLKYVTEVQNIPEEAENENFADCQNSNHDDHAKSMEFDFDDATSWSDAALSSDCDEINETIIESNNRSDISSPESMTTAPIMKRVISKKQNTEIPEKNLSSRDEFPIELPHIPNTGVTTTTSPPSYSTLVNNSEISDVVKQKLSELEQEIKRFRSENEILSKLRKERENDLQMLRKEIQSFQKQKDEEIKHFEEYRNEEMKKIKMERKAFNKYQKAAREIPNKQEREEIKNLKQANEELQNELTTRESRWKAASHRLRCRVNELEEANNELKSEIKILEQERLQRWKEQHSSKMVKRKVISPPAEDQNIEDVPLQSQVSARSLWRQDSTSSNDSDSSDECNNMLSFPRTESKHRIPEVAIVKTSDKNLKASNVSDSLPKVSLNMVESRVSSQQSEKHKSEIYPADNRMFVNDVTSGPRSNFDKPADDVDGKTDVHDGKTNVHDGKGLVYDDGKVEEILADGSKLITFPNGTKKQISPDNKNIIIQFFNGDMKKIFPDSRIVYFYEETKTTHTTYPNGMEMIEFPNLQIEKRFPDGSTEISFPDRTIKHISADGSEKTTFPDGTIQTVDTTGVRIISFTNGQKEIHTQAYKRREYPNGTVKTVYNDGRQETKYSSGRLRVKDKDGNLLVDTFS